MGNCISSPHTSNSNYLNERFDEEWMRSNSLSQPQKPTRNLKPWTAVPIYTSTEEVRLTTYVQERRRLQSLDIDMDGGDYFEIRKIAIATDPTMAQRFENIECLTEEDIIVSEDDPDFDKFEIPYCCICMCRMRLVCVAAMPCEHKICQQCMFNLAYSKQTNVLSCPMCRASFEHPKCFRDAFVVAKAQKQGWLGCS